MRIGIAVTLLMVVLIGGDGPAQQSQSAWDGEWWEGQTQSYKFGWVAGYAKAMQLAGTIQMSTCAANMPLFAKALPNTDPKVIMERMCLSDTQFDYDGIAMGALDAGIEAFYKDYRNQQIEASLAIQYARDEIKGKPAQQIEAEVTVWRRCSAADRSHPMPRSAEDATKVAKACTPDASPQ